MSTAAPIESRTDTIDPHGNPPRADATIAASASESPLAASASDPPVEQPSSDSVVLAASSETTHSKQGESIPAPANSNCSTVTRRLLRSPQDTPDDSAWDRLSEDEADVSSVEVAEENHCASSEDSSSDEIIFLLDDDLRARVTAYI
ncbi:hypothetical protein PF001_g29680 [Phytophthora fragariae]|uniref:Uncharacterized protein n=1 Tax=Phytophthora fragariae TaxID=53985 RepID=A0A6A3DHH7_9STRA|nr:hypothetical protein PF009_g31683 [Phytophthora fragariae]KAE9268361.1 hypothetical protein PF001_g29680 [Phytophthora fragariae]